MRTLRIPLVLAAVLGLALAATSAAGAAPAASGARPSATAKAALTPAAYRAKAGALCAQAKKRIAGLPKSTSAKPAQIASALNKALKAIDPLVPQFRQLSPPASLKAVHLKTVQGLSDGLAIGHQIAVAIGKGSNLQQAMAKVQAPFLTALSSIQTGFKQLGLTTCESVLGSALGGA